MAHVGTFIRNTHDVSEHLGCSRTSGVRPLSYCPTVFENSVDSCKFWQGKGFLGDIRSRFFRAVWRWSTISNLVVMRSGRRTKGASAKGGCQRRRKTFPPYFSPAGRWLGICAIYAMRGKRTFFKLLSVSKYYCRNGADGRMWSIINIE